MLTCPDPINMCLCARHYTVGFRPASERLSVGRTGTYTNNVITARRFEQFYTLREVASFLVGILRECYDLYGYQVVEPSAGNGSFLNVLPPNTIAVDVDPQHPGVRKANFLDIELASAKPIIVIGNPPFGQGSSMAIAFFNHSAKWARIIAMIHPKTFRKASVENRLDSAFHLVREETVPQDAFLFMGKPHDVPTIFQIWERREESRPKRIVRTHHPDFCFTTQDRSDFSIQRVGARAGRVHHDPHASPSSNYFIKGPVEEIMRGIDFTVPAGNTAGNPSLAKSEIIDLYCDYVQRSDCRTAGVTIALEQLQHAWMAEVVPGIWTGG